MAEEFQGEDGDTLVMCKGTCKEARHYIPAPWTTGKTCQCGKRKLTSMYVENGQVVAFEVKRHA